MMRIEIPPWRPALAPPAAVRPVDELSAWAQARPRGSVSTAAVPDGVTLVGWTTGIRSVIAKTGLVAAPLEPHEFATAMHLLYVPPAGASVATVPNVVTPRTSDRCARDGCDRPRSDPIHRLPED